MTASCYKVWEYLSGFICVCMHVCNCTYVRECTRICVHVCALRAYVCMHVHICTLCEYACVHVCMHICVSML